MRLTLLLMVLLLSVSCSTDPADMPCDLVRKKILSDFRFLKSALDLYIFDNQRYPLKWTREPYLTPALVSSIFGEDESIGLKLGNDFFALRPTVEANDVVAFSNVRLWLHEQETASYSPFPQFWIVVRCQEGIHVFVDGLEWLTLADFYVLLQRWKEEALAKGISFDVTQIDYIKALFEADE